MPTPAPYRANACAATLCPVHTAPQPLGRFHTERLEKPWSALSFSLSASLEPSRPPIKWNLHLFLYPFPQPPCSKSLFPLSISQNGALLYSFPKLQSHGRRLRLHHSGASSTK